MFAENGTFPQDNDLQIYIIRYFLRKSGYSLLEEMEMSEEEYIYTTDLCVRMWIEELKRKSKSLGG